MGGIKVTYASLLRGTGTGKILGELYLNMWDDIDIQNLLYMSQVSI